MFLTSTLLLDRLLSSSALVVSNVDQVPQKIGLFLPLVTLASFLVKEIPTVMIALFLTPVLTLKCLLKVLSIARTLEATIKTLSTKRLARSARLGISVLMELLIGFNAHLLTSQLELLNSVDLALLAMNALMVISQKCYLVLMDITLLENKLLVLYVLLDLAVTLLKPLPVLHTCGLMKVINTAITTLLENLRLLHTFTQVLLQRFNSLLVELVNTPCMEEVSALTVQEAITALLLNLNLSNVSLEPLQLLLHKPHATLVPQVNGLCSVNTNATNALQDTSAHQPPLLLLSVVLENTQLLEILLVHRVHLLITNSRMDQLQTLLLKTSVLSE